MGQCENPAQGEEPTAARRPHLQHRFTYIIINTQMFNFTNTQRHGHVHRGTFMHNWTHINKHNMASELLAPFIMSLW